MEIIMYEPWLSNKQKLLIKLKHSDWGAFFGLTNVWNQYWMKWGCKINFIGLGPDKQNLSMKLKEKLFRDKETCGQRYKPMTNTTKEHFCCTKDEETGFNKNKKTRTTKDREREIK